MSQRPHLLMVESDDNTSRALLEQFEASGEYTLDFVKSGADAEKRLAQQTMIDAILMNDSLVDGDGRSFCAEFRRKGFKSPVLLIGNDDSEQVVVEGLDAGANDFIAKPFRFAVLAARVRAHLRSHEQSEDAVFRIGPYEFWPSSKMLHRDNGSKIRLTEKEASILKYLYRRRGEPVTRDVLLNEVWGYNSGVTTHTLETHIYRLRQKIEPVSGQTSLLVTEPGGYRLVTDGVPVGSA